MRAYHNSLVLVAVAAMLVFMSLGCKKDTPEPQNDSGNGLSSVQAQAEQFEEVLSLWDSGDKERAAAGFLKVNWQSPQVFSEKSILSLPEGEFVTMSASERDEIRGQAMALAGTIRQLVMHVLESGKASLGAKDYEAAESRFNAVFECGSALSGSDGLAIMKMVGSSVQGAALKELIQLYTDTKDRAKLNAAQEKLSQLQ